MSLELRQKIQNIFVPYFCNKVSEKILIDNLTCVVCKEIISIEGLVPDCKGFKCEINNGNNNKI
jgi:hypothetical protein